MGWRIGKWNETLLGSNNVRVVREDQTVQEVLNSISDASENNRYLVLVPSGHENEYFDWKPYVDVKFLDNLEEKWQLDELEGWDDLSNWAISSGFVADLAIDRGNRWLKLTRQSGYHFIYFKNDLDLRKYQGVLLRFRFPVTDPTDPLYIKVKTEFTGTDGGFVSTGYWSQMGIGVYDRLVFLPFGSDSYNLQYVDLDKIDWSTVRLHFLFYGGSDGDEIYLSDFKLVRTFPYPSVFVKMEGSTIGNNSRVDALKEFVGMGVPVAWAINASKIGSVTASDDIYPTPELLHEFQRAGLIDIVNHSLSYVNFKDLNERDTLFEVTSSRFVFERLGLVSALKWWDNPDISTNPYLERFLSDFGYVSVYSRISGIPVADNLKYDEVPDNFQPLKKGGIITLPLDTNQVSTENLDELLNKISVLRSFCRFVGLSHIENLMGSNRSLSQRQIEPTLFRVLDADFTIQFFHKNLFLDPNGVDRNLYIDYTYFRAGDSCLIVNVGTDGNLILDPEGRNITITPGSSYTFIYY